MLARKVCDYQLSLQAYFWRNEVQGEAVPSLPFSILSNPWLNIDFQEISKPTRGKALLSPTCIIVCLGATSVLCMRPCPCVIIIVFCYINVTLLDFVFTGCDCIWCGSYSSCKYWNLAPLHRACPPLTLNAPLLPQLPPSVLFQHLLLFSLQHLHLLRLRHQRPVLSHAN